MQAVFGHETSSDVLHLLQSPLGRQPPARLFYELLDGHAPGHQFPRPLAAPVREIGGRADGDGPRGLGVHVAQPVGEELDLVGCEGGRRWGWQRAKGRGGVWETRAVPEQYKEQMTRKWNGAQAQEGRGVDRG